MSKNSFHWQTSNQPNRNNDFEERERPYKKRGGKKPFVIECRYIGEQKSWMSDEGYKSQTTWFTHNKYKTEKARAQALAHLEKQKDNYYEFPSGKKYYPNRNWEYRIKI